MKKIVAFAAAMVAALSLASATDITVGGRGAFGFGLGTSVEDPIELDMGKTMNFGGAVFGKIGITDTISIQPEIGFSARKVGVKQEFSYQSYDYETEEETTESVSYKGTVGFNTLDIPVLVGYNLELSDGLTVTPFAGPQLSLVLGKGKLGGDMDGDLEFKSSVLFDLVLGANLGYEVGPGALVADLRYNLGLVALKDKDSGDKICTPRALGLSVGYQIKLGE